MTTVTRTAGAAGSITVVTRNSGGSFITPVSTPTVTWYTDAARTAGALALTVTGAAGTYTATWTGAQAPASQSTRYLKITIETAAAVFSVDADDDISFLAASASIGSTDYTTLAAVKHDLGIDVDDESDDDAITASIRAASRAIEKWTGTTFYAVVETRIFATRDNFKVWTDRFTSVAGLVVKTGSGGVFSTTVADTGYLLWPYNAASKGRAYNRIDSPGGLFSVENRPTIEVTASWGWHYLPEDVERAARLKAAELYRRKDSPESVVGALDETITRLYQHEDRDIVSLLKPYAESWIR